ncbi:MAG: DUF2125 domain-containing protein [Pseudomonadota bacterium]
MRRTIWSVLIIALLWSAWWFGVAATLRSGVTGWLDDRRAEGWQAEALGTRLTGFPWRTGVSLDGLALADPATGLALGLDQLTITAPTHWPADPSLMLPDTPITFATPDGGGALQMTSSTMALDTYPGTALELAGLSWTSGPWRLSGPAGEALTASALRLTATHVDGARYGLGAEAPDLAPGAALRLALRVPDAWPAQFDALMLDAEVAFDTAWDRFALEQRRPQPREIRIALAEARWGDLNLRLAADLTVDTDGVPSGTANIRAVNWPVMLDLAQTAGVLDPRLRAQAQAGLTRLARLSGNPETLDVQLNFAAGFVAVGIIPIGPAPRLIIR